MGHWTPTGIEPTDYDDDGVLLTKKIDNSEIDLKILAKFLVLYRI